ncbi:MAG: TonB-dependent receptor, partial [Burkholderiaceae bacterium]
GEVESTKSWNISGPRKGNIYYRLPDGSRDPREQGDRYRQINGNPEVDKQVVSYDLSYPIADLEFVSFGTFGHRDAIGAVNFRDATSTQNLLEVYPDGFLPRYGIEENDFQVLAGVKGAIATDWDWSLDTSFSRNHSKIRLEDALSASFGNATPENPINGYTAPPTELYNGGFDYRQWVTDLDVKGNLATGWSDTPLGVAFGAEFRKEWFQQLQGEYASWADGGYVFPAGHPRAGGRPSPGGAGTQGYGPDAVVDVSRNVAAAYVDVEQAIGKLELGAALRFENYSDVGDALAGKLSARYNFTERYGVRATFNNSFKAPTLQQQYFTHANEVWGTLSISGQQGITNTFVSGPFTPFAAALGAEALKPQKSNNISVGFTGTPTDNLDFSIDVYQIGIQDRLVLQESGQVGETARILANAGLIDPQGNYEYVVRYTSNGIDTRTRGADLVVNYTTEFGRFGQVKWTLLNAYNETSITGMRVVPAAFQDVISPGNFFSRSALGLYTAAKPKNSTFLTADWSIDRWDARATAKRYSKVRELHNTSPARDHVISAAWVADLDIGFRINERLRASAGGTNIFGRRPEGVSAAQEPFEANASPTYGYFAPYGAWGAFFYGKLEYTW